MPTKSGANIFDGVVSADTAEIIIGPYVIGNNISIGLDAEIINGAIPPSSVPLLLEIQWRRYPGGRWSSHPFQGSLGANDIAPIKNYKIPFDSHEWRIKYVGGDEDVTLKIDYGVYAP
jgi:hypothetical protein